MNDYHGDLPPHTTVFKGQWEQAFSEQHSDKTLLLCYPPPNSRMALDAISQFKGAYFALVGEFAGDTGT
jgi:hypothetical protein|tara:strand:- start:336 stop:542 length:207 start_codon:yes stop_codon:yes gene_type:complete